MQNSLSLLTPPFRPGLFGQDGVPAEQRTPLVHWNQERVLVSAVFDVGPVQKLVEDSSVGISSSTDSDILPEPQVLHLMPDSVLFPVSGSFGLVGFDAADVVGGALHQGLDQTICLFLEG